MLAVAHAVRVLENLRTGLSPLGLRAAEQDRVAAVCTPGGWRVQCPWVLHVEMSQGKAQGGLIGDLGSSLGFMWDHRGGTVPYM